MNATPDPTLEPLKRLVGTWTTEATHPALAGQVLPGTSTFEWLEGKRFLIHRSHTAHPDVPDAISVIGHMELDRVDNATGGVQMAGTAGLHMQYFDARGVFRVYAVRVDAASWRWWRDAPGFSQRFVGTFEAGGNVIVGRSQLCQDEAHWRDDLQVTYRRQG